MTTSDKTIYNAMISELQEVVANVDDEWIDWLLNSKDAIEDVTGYKKPSQKTRQEFPEWKKRSFNQEYLLNGNILKNKIPATKFLNNEIERLAMEIIHLYSELDAALLMEKEIESYYLLAKIAGKLDYLLTVFKKINFEGKLIDYLQTLRQVKSQKIKKGGFAPEDFFKDFELIKEVMKEHCFINEKEENLIGNKEGWKIAALNDVIILHKKELCKQNVSGNKLQKVFNLFLNTSFIRPKKNADEFDDLSTAIKKTFAILSSIKAPKN